MSKVRILKKSQKIYNDAIKISNTLLNLSISNIHSSKKKYLYYKEILDLYFELLNNHKLNFNLEPIYINIFSDTGFCGTFNKYNVNSNDINIGKKSSNFTYLNSEVNKNINLLLNKINGYNIIFRFKNYKTETIEEIKFSDFYNYKKENEFIKEYEYENLLKDSIQCFCLYSLNLAVFNENNYRLRIMNAALDNSKTLLKNLKINFSKVRKEFIDSELSLTSLNIAIEN